MQGQARPRGRREVKPHRGLRQWCEVEDGECIFGWEIWPGGVSVGRRRGGARVFGLEGDWLGRQEWANVVESGVSEGPSVGLLFCG